MNAKNSDTKNLRVISGSAKGRRLYFINAPGIRPFTDRIRESLFTSLWNRAPRETVLDIFAGSGIFGIEALSRGARSCTFVENNARCTSVIQKNIALCGFSSAASIVSSDAESWIFSRSPETMSCDIITLDPPFGYGKQENGRNIARMITRLVSVALSEGGTLIYRSERSEPSVSLLRETFPDLREKRFGRSNVVLLDAVSTACPQPEPNGDSAAT